MPARGRSLRALLLLAGLAVPLLLQEEGPEEKPRWQVGFAALAGELLPRGGPREGINVREPGPGEGHLRPRTPELRRDISRHTAKYRANETEAWGNVALTVFMWVSGVAAVHFTSHWAAITFLALVQMRCFMMFHDAAHLSYFEKAADNRIFATIIQFFVNYSYQGWDDVHNPHHAHLGDNTVRDASLTVFYSEDELAKAPWYVSVLHRVIRDPLLFFPLAGFFVFFVNKPHVHGPSRALLPLLIWALLGPQTVVGYILAAWVAASLGVACFHLQHHCNRPYRVQDKLHRSAMDAALLGSTRIKVPFPLSFFSFGIEYHHIHHFDIRVPGYKLQRCDEDGEKLGLWDAANTVSGIRAFKSLFHTQFEGARRFEEAGEPPRFVSFWPYRALGLQDA